MESRTDFEWDENKDKSNQEKHGVSFALAQLAFLDHNRLNSEDLEQGINEERYSSGKSLCQYLDGEIYISFR